MFLEESQMSRLKEYLISSLEAISDADNEALSEYIIALIRNDKPLLQIKKNARNSLKSS
ncbi:hypothetical protein DSO57_1017706 [Entomophthora muscae]|uniref:Uncharacterized protein n=1 Tax=Entomophthora muscae TaxID=34485 RepID=A0ACC2U2C9_9FUNG|nr:hypothetical protein DSO57_1017706 [Entomophthora muscae]